MHIDIDVVPQEQLNGGYLQSQLYAPGNKVQDFLKKATFHLHPQLFPHFFPYNADLNPTPKVQVFQAGAGNAQGICSRNY